MSTDTLLLANCNSITMMEKKKNKLSIFITKRSFNLVRLNAKQRKKTSFCKLSSCFSLTNSCGIEHKQRKKNDKYPKIVSFTFDP